MKLLADEENMSHHVCKIPPCLEEQPVFKLTKELELMVSILKHANRLSLCINMVFSLKSTILEILKTRWCRDKQLI